MTIPGKTVSSSLVTDPLFSTIITLYLLILLYFPTLFLGLVFSPVLISASILLLSLLRLGATQRTTQEENEKNNPIPAEPNSAQLIVSHTHDFFADDRKWVSQTGSDSGPFYAGNSFVEWDLRAPLEVIYEEYEGQEEEDDDGDDVLEGKRDARMAFIERYASLSKFYPETDDSDASSEEDFPAIREWDPPENLSFRWEGEDREGLIEIALEGKGFSDGEEDNLIEINLYPASSPAR